jgi:hypothetical protein
MNDLTNKMILDGYKSLSDKCDEMDHRLKKLYAFYRDHHSAIIELDNKVNCYIHEDDEELTDDEEYIRDALRYSDIETLLLLVRKIMKEKNCTTHEIIKEIIRNA